MPALLRYLKTADRDIIVKDNFHPKKKDEEYFTRNQTRNLKRRKFNPIRLSWVVQSQGIFLSHYSESVYPENTYPHHKKTLGLEDPLAEGRFSLA